MATMRTTTTKATSFFDTTTNLMGRCIPGREGGGDFNGNDNYDKNNGDDEDSHKDTTMTTTAMMMMTTWLDAFLVGGVN
jgi:hypothetical protein